jgi:nicotinate-nucleotide adenylyltransferase
MRVGLFGGSFNPAHEGHAHVAETARARLGLDKVIWLVSPQNPLKPSHETEALTRRMFGAVRVARGSAMQVSDAETRIGARYTIDTVRVLKARFPKVHFVWVMGADSLATFHRWRGWTQLMRTLPVAVSRAHGRG